MVQHAIALSVGSVLSRSFGYWAKNFVAFTVISLLVQSPVILYALLAPIESKTQAYLYGAVVGFGPVVMSLVAASAVAYGVFQQIRGQPAPLGDCLRIGFRRLFPVLGVALLVGLATMAGLLLLVVPGIIIACICYVAVPVAVVEQPGVTGSISRSAFLTKGARAAIFGITILLGLVTRVTGWIITALVSGLKDPETIGDLRTQSVAAVAVECVFGTLLAVASVIVYYDLRVQKEQVDVEKIVQVFA
jgi:hypothetical protein